MVFVFLRFLVPRGGWTPSVHNPGLEIAREILERTRPPFVHDVGVGLDRDLEVIAPFIPETPVYEARTPAVEIPLDRVFLFPELSHLDIIVGIVTYFPTIGYVDPCGEVHIAVDPPVLAYPGLHNIVAHVERPALAGSGAGRIGIRSRGHIVRRPDALLLLQLPFGRIREVAAQRDRETGRYGLRNELLLVGIICVAHPEIEKIGELRRHIARDGRESPVRVRLGVVVAAHAPGQGAVLLYLLLPLSELEIERVPD